MDPTILKSLVCAVAIVGAVVLAALGAVTGAEALDFTRTVLVAGVAGLTVAGVASKWAASKSPIVAAVEQVAAPLIEAAAPTPRNAPKVPPLPLLALLLALAACTPAEVRAADKAAIAAEPGCKLGLRLADAAELAPLCAELPEIVDAVAELVHEAQPATGTAVHRRVAARRTGAHRDAGAP